MQNTKSYVMNSEDVKEEYFSRCEICVTTGHARHILLGLAKKSKHFMYILIIWLTHGRQAFTHPCVLDDKSSTFFSL